MNIPPFIYSLKFWQSVSVLVAVIAVQLGYAPLSDAGIVLMAILAILRLFEVVPELRARGLWK